MELNKFVEKFSTQKIENSDVNKYRVLSASDSQVFALDMEDYKPYGFSYAFTTENDTENLIIDFDSKVEMSLSATEKITEKGFEEFSIKNEIDTISNETLQREIPLKVNEYTKSLEKEFTEEMENLKSEYTDVSKSCSIALKKLAEYEKAENEAKIKAHRDEVNALFDKYAEKLSKCAEFLVYKAKCDPDKVTVEDVNNKLALMVGKFTMENSMKKSFSYTPTETHVQVKTKDTVENKYGHLLDKYINR